MVTAGKPAGGGVWKWDLAYLLTDLAKPVKYAGLPLINPMGYPQNGDFIVILDTI
jgi:hypothetical protein